MSSIAAAAVVALLVGLGGIRAVVRACSYAPPPMVQGLLGVAEFYAPAGGLEVPRNAAVLGADITLLQTGESVSLAALPGHPDLFQPLEPLPVGAMIEVQGVQAHVVDVIDESPPSGPRITDGRIHRPRGNRGCVAGEGPECVDIVTLNLGFEPGDDDTTPPSRMTYILFMGTTRDEVAGMELQEGEWLLAADVTHLWFPLDFAADVDPDWVALQAVDQAGNVSPRSEPFRLGD
jgi:hypothetical protein